MKFVAIFVAAVMYCSSVNIEIEILKKNNPNKLAIAQKQQQQAKSIWHILLSLLRSAIFSHFKKKESIMALHDMSLLLFWYACVCVCVCSYRSEFAGIAFVWRLCLRKRVAAEATAHLKSIDASLLLLLKNGK